MIWLEIFSKILARVKQNNKYGYIDKTGKIVIQPQFDEANAFYEGLASVEKNKKWGYIDKTGKIVIQPQFDLAGNFFEDFSKGKTK